MTEKKTNKEITKENLELANKMIEKIKTMDEKDFYSFMDQVSLFHDYSFCNRMLIMFAGATNVKGFKQWQELGRNVKKGEKAIWIFAPTTRRIKEEKDGKEIDKNIITGFMSVPVFDISQTDGEPLPETMTFKSAVDFSVMAEIANQLQFTIEKQPMDFNYGGFIVVKESKIVLNSVKSELDNTGTLIHEICHGLLEHNPEMDKALKEHEAELLTYLVCHRINVERKSEFYLKSWQMTDDILKSMNRINTAYNKFMKVFNTTVCKKVKAA